MRRCWLASVLPPRGRTPLRWRLGALVAAALPLALGVGVPSSASASPTYTVTATLGLPGPPNAVAVYPLAKTVYISGGILTPLPFGWFEALDTTTYHAVPFYQLAQPLGGYTGLAVNPIANRLYEAYSIPPTPTPIGVLQFQRASYTLPAPVLGPSIGPQGVTVGSDAFGVAVNPLTNRVYVTNIGDGTVSVISGLGERGSPQSRPVIATIRVGSSPARVAVNPLTRTAYVTNSGSGSVSVIDLRTNKVTTTIPVGGRPDGVAVNPVTNRVYVADGSGGAVTVIDGATNAVTTIQAGSCHSDVATDPTTNTIYVANLCSSSLAVIDGVTNTVTATVPVGGSPTAVAVNPITHTVYVANLGNPGSPTLSVITVQPIPTS